jgi:hypothetical protein
MCLVWPSSAMKYSPRSGSGYAVQAVMTGPAIAAAAAGECMAG